jgi:glucosamine kinase
MGRLLAIDGGRSGCRAAVLGPLGREATGTGRGLPALTGPDGLPDVVQAVGEAVAQCWPDSDFDSGTIEAVVAGLAGLLGSFEHAPVLARRLARLLGVERVVLTGDVVTAYAGAVGLRPGVVVVAGTGAVALGVGPGSAARSDGWGHLLGDAGSGFWIGRRGLEQALRAHDGRGGSAVLAGLAEGHLGPLDELPARIEASGKPVATVAAFARQVAQAAGCGDEVAGSIWAEAAAELAASAAGCARRLFPAGTRVPISWSGGLFAAGSPDGDLLLQPFLDRLTHLLPDCLPTSPEADALAGAALLAGPGGPGLLGRFVYDSTREAGGVARESGPVRGPARSEPAVLI